MVAELETRVEEGVRGVMPDFLENTTWQWFIGIIVTVMVGLATIFVPRYLGRARKQLWYRDSAWPLVDTPSDKRIKILFDDQPVRDIFLVILRLRFRGNQPV